MVKTVLRLIYLFFSGFFYKKKSAISLSELSEINILLVGKIGIGDVLMLSPLISILNSNFSARVNLITNYSDFFSLEKTYWVKPKFFKSCKKSLLIAPNFSYENIRYIKHCDYFLGYFFGDFLSGNIPYKDFKINHRDEHYFSRCFPILKALGCRFSESNLPYPKLKNEFTSLGFEGDYVAISPYVNWPARQYQSSSYITIIKTILERTELDVVLLGSSNAEELKFINKIMDSLPATGRLHNYSGQLSLNQLFGVIDRARYFIGNDSGPLHISFLSNCLSIGVFGAILPSNRVPVNPELLSNIITFSDVDSCNLYPCYDGFNEPICSRCFACTRSINPESVIKIVI